MRTRNYHYDALEGPHNITVYRAILAAIEIYQANLSGTRNKTRMLGI